MSCTGPQRKVALITGITGQDGSYLAELLLSKGYVVHGIIRRSSNFNTQRIDHIYEDPHQSQNFFLHYGDLTDAGSLSTIVNKVWPSEVYNLACQSHVGISFQEPIYSVEVGTVGTIALLEAIRQVHAQDEVKYYQASSSEMFGKSPPPQSEKTPFQPRSPYACGKVYAYYQTINYREAYNMFTCNGILFNHESPRRGGNFVTKKITNALVRIKHKLQDKLYLGNLDSKRDWGFAGDYVEAMWLMLQHNQPDDYVVATGEQHSVKEFLEVCCDFLDMGDWQQYVEIDQRYIRPAEVDSLCGDASKAKDILGWVPKVSFRDLVGMMLTAEMKALACG